MELVNKFHFLSIFDSFSDYFYEFLFKNKDIGSLLSQIQMEELYSLTNMQLIVKCCGWILMAKIYCQLQLIFTKKNK